LDLLLGRWAQHHTRPTDGRRVVAIDGKTLRGSRGADGTRRHLLAAFDHTYGIILGQVDVATKTNEVPMLPVLLADIDIADAVITADAMHAVRSHAVYLHERGAHYVLTVKSNQPGYGRNWPGCRGLRFPSRTAAAKPGTAAWKPAPSKPSRSPMRPDPAATVCCSHTPPKPSRLSGPVRSGPGPRL
jgi:Transposase DDE domain